MTKAKAGLHNLMPYTGKINILTVSINTTHATSVPFHNEANNI